jgi:hypothetical protein
LGFYHIFSHFNYWDDEGYVLLSIKEFISQGELYDTVYSQYGPFLYLYRSIIHSFLPVSHDAGRIINLLEWVFAACFLGLTAKQLFRSPGFSIWVLFSGFWLSRMAALHPGHPQSLIILQISIICALFGFWIHKSTTHTMRALSIFIVGLLSAAIACVKINVGAFVLLPILLVMSTASPHKFVRKVCIYMFSLCAIMLPLVLMKKLIHNEWCLRFCVVMTVAIMSSLFHLIRKENQQNAVVAIDWYLLISGYIGGLSLYSLFAFWTGSSLGGLLDGILFGPARHGTDYFVPIHLSNYTIILSIAGLVFSVLITFGKQYKYIYVFCAILKGILFGALFYAIVVADQRQSILFISLSWLWVLIYQIPSRQSKHNPLKLLIVMLAIMLPLVNYPVSSHLSGSWYMHSIVIALVLHDMLKSWEYIGNAGIIPVQPLVNWSTAILAAAGIGIVLHGTWNNYRDYPLRTSLNLSGARRLRLPFEQTRSYYYAAQNVIAHGADFFTVPGLNSFHLWCQKEPITGLNTTFWMGLLDDEQQNAIISNIKKTKKFLVLEGDYSIWTKASGKDYSTKPLMKYIYSLYTNRKQCEQFTFRYKDSTKHHQRYIIAGEHKFEGKLEHAIPLPTFPLKPQSTICLHIEILPVASDGVLLGHADVTSFRIADTSVVLLAFKEGKLYLVNEEIDNVIEKNKWSSLELLLGSGNIKLMYNNDLVARVAYTPNALRGLSGWLGAGYSSAEKEWKAFEGNMRNVYMYY